jgi:mono/diheme cytochrome c family protein
MALREGRVRREEVRSAGRLPDVAPRVAARPLLAPLAVVLAVGQAAWLGYPLVRSRVLSLEESAAARGERLAHTLGCFACHGAGGAGGTGNPGSKEISVPAFTERTQMMYVRDEEDLREYILDGAPRRRREDPEYRARMAAAAIRMPAYRPFVTAAEVEDLVAYLRATSGQVVPDQATLARGAELAGELGCFSCHGPLGGGGVANPGSLKGYIPAFWGEDFDDLVRDDAELRAWIADGEIPRIADHPIGRRWFRRQAIKMPAYGRFLPPADVDALVAYVRWIRAGAWRRDGVR